MNYQTLLSIFSLFLLSILVQAQQNMSLVANVQIDDEANDIWGFVGNDGTEYAIIGAVNSTRIFSLADPANPVEVIKIPGDRSGWRDIKSVGDFIYVIADQGNDGLLSINMSNAPDSIDYQYFNPILDEAITTREATREQIDSMEVNGILTYDTTMVTETVSDTLFTFLRTCHNLYSTDDFLYTAGCNGGSQYNGVMIFDPSKDPYKPTFVGKESNSYAHDVYVNGNTMFASEINRGALAIFDISDKTSPTLIGSQFTGFTFTHNAWTNDDGTTVFTTDERGNAFVEAYDVSDPSNILFLDNFKPIESAGKGVIPHNTHYMDGFLYTSYYTDGVIVTDANKPDNLIQVGQYDTWPGADGGFFGNWGAYPFLPSGLILASDRATGLYILQSEVKRACYLEGNITDKETGLAINGVEISIRSKDPNLAKSDAAGAFKTGQASSGTYEVIFKHPNYNGKVVEVDFNHGECLLLNVELEELRKVRVNFVSTLESNAQSLPDVNFSLFNSLNDYGFTTSAKGTYVSSFINVGMYKLVAGKWGFKTIEIDSIFIDADTQLDIKLEEGIEDDFRLDLGWRSLGDSPSGRWQRAIPVGTFFGSKASNVTEDLPDDLGEYCYVTGNVGGNAGADDVDDGEVILRSPLTDLSNYENPVVQYSLWFFNEGGAGGAPDDTLNVYVTNQTETVLIEQITDTLGLPGMWMTPSEIEIKDLIELNSAMRFIFQTSDGEIGHLVEAGVDGFSIIDKTTTPTLEVEEDNISFVYPNPTKDFLSIDIQELGTAHDWSAEIITIEGRTIMRTSDINKGSISIQSIPSGTYLIILSSPSSEKLFRQKFVKIGL